MQWDFAAHTTQVIPSETMSRIQLLFALGSGPICTHKERGRGLPRLLWLINQKPQSELLTSLSMLCSHIMQYTCFTLLIMTRRHCGGLVWAVLNCLWCFMHGPYLRCGAFLNAAPREQPVQPRFGPVWADLVESVDLVSSPTCTNAVHSHLIQMCTAGSNQRWSWWSCLKGWPGRFWFVCFFDCICEAKKPFCCTCRTPRERFICAKCSLAFCLF